MGEAAGPLDWATAGAPLAGEDVSGDLAVVECCGDDYLLAAIDGLGHGPEAAVAAEIAGNTIRENACEPLDSILVLCHRAMTRTRGAAITLVRIHPDAASLTWVGVGNVDAALVRILPEGTRAVEAPLLYGGIVGYQLPAVHARTIDLRHGDLVLLATDGVAASFAEGLRVSGDLTALAAEILLRHARGTDDSLVLAARYWGTPPAGR
jgi:negative regulator of sigma-B (phosphoserine phosphatase)